MLEERPSYRYIPDAQLKWGLIFERTRFLTAYASTLAIDTFAMFNLYLFLRYPSTSLNEKAAEIGFAAGALLATPTGIVLGNMVRRESNRISEELQQRKVVRRLLS